MATTISFNKKILIQTEGSGPLCSKENPLYRLGLYIPLFGIKWNKQEEYASNVFSLKIHAPTELALVCSDKGAFIKIVVNILGFGISFSRQSDY